MNPAPKRLLNILMSIKISPSFLLGAGYAAKRATAAHWRQQALVAGPEQSHADRLRPFQLRAQGEALHIWQVSLIGLKGNDSRMQTGYVPSNYVRKEKPSIFDRSVW